MAINIGDKIPEFLGFDQNGQEFHRADFPGKKWIVYFYPKDNTPGCTAEACSLRDEYSEIKALGYEIVGISVDKQAAHQKFIAAKQLPFTLIADEEHKMVELFGVWGEKKFMGKQFMGTLRTTFIADENGVVTHILTPKQIKTSIHAQQLLEIIKQA
ncbi:MAG: thioredoxin-dependent thiol peroxidase [Bacteroidetes bacterium]|uniref:thioredoxin-dependent peroxiredoxin n=1 Tax=Candidatus Gallipaludibacter merdavium TaxID=2840839 RepID=A0A9D9HT29_9BACT|nr:thioredoxin-dependent thiol peroxidase [Candidatus Gallipaludibacter merdavium]